MDELFSQVDEKRKVSRKIDFIWKMFASHIRCLHFAIPACIKQQQEFLDGKNKQASPHGCAFFALSAFPSRQLLLLT